MTSRGDQEITISASEFETRFDEVLETVAHGKRVMIVRCNEGPAELALIRESELKALRAAAGEESTSSEESESARKGPLQRE